LNIKHAKRLLDSLPDGAEVTCIDVQIDGGERLYLGRTEPTREPEQYEVETRQFTQANFERLK
jgi:hypothetical protein